MSLTPVNFVLSALNNVILLETSAVIPGESLSLTSDATITLTEGMTVAQAQNTFFFRTDNPITLDASFVYYYVDTAKWANKAVVLSPKNGIVTSNPYVASDAVGKDFLRDLAKQLFGTYLGADLFTNEDSVISDINSKCDTVATNLISLLSSIDKTSGTLSALQTDSSGDKYFADNATTSNISRELFNQLMTNAVSRFRDIKTNYKKNASEDGMYRMPILAGDSITFKMSISPASGQIAAVPTGSASLLNRTYTVILNIIPTPPTYFAPPNPTFFFEFGPNNTTNTHMTNSITGTSYLIYTNTVPSNVSDGYCRFASLPSGTNYIDFHNTITLGTSFSISFWLNVHSIVGLLSLVELASYNKPNFPSLQIFFCKITIDSSLKLGSNSITSTTPLAADSWKQLTFTFSRSANTLTCKGYVNGISDANLSYNTPIDSRILGTDTVTDYTVGRTNVGTLNASLYYIDNLRHYNYALSATQANDLYQVGDGDRSIII